MTTTEDDRAFEILEVKDVDENVHKLVGLTLKTLKVNDVVFATDSPHISASDSASFAVAKILVFGRELTEIDRGFYVELFVSGVKGNVLKAMKYLCLK